MQEGSGGGSGGGWVLGEEGGNSWERLSGQNRIMLRKA